jgi:hypothetical protein
MRGRGEGPTNGLRSGMTKELLTFDSRFEMAIPLYQPVGTKAQKLLILRRREECVVGHVTKQMHGHLEAFNISVDSVRLGSYVTA